MTEEEAKTRWCPFGAGTDKPISAYVQTEHDRCIGSACMAWRREHARKDTRYIPVGEPLPEGWAETMGFPAYTEFRDGIECRMIISRAAWEHGYCGLAGKP